MTSSLISDAIFRGRTGAAAVPAMTHGGATASRRDLYELVGQYRSAIAEKVGTTAGTTIAIICNSPVHIFSTLHASLLLDLGVVLCDPTWPPSFLESALARTNATHSVVATDVTRVAIERLPGGADTAHVVNAGEVVSFTSGTTGVPKAIVHSERTIAAALVMLVDETDPQVHNREITSNSMADLLQRADGDVSYFEGGPVLLSCMPPWTQGGFTMMNYATFMGCHLVVSWPFDAESALDQIERHAATSIGLSPFMAQLILRAQRYRPRKTESLLVVGLGGGPVSPRLAKNLEATFDCRVLIGYGLTETGGAVVRSRWSDPSEVRTQTVGSPMPGVELGLRHLPGQHSTEPAELRVRTRSLMVATIDELGHRQSVDPDSWLDTGDLAVVDGPGAIRIVGRLASLIVRGGRNIDPSTIEATLRDHAQVADCAVVGVESRLEGEQDVVAYVVLGTDLEPSKHELVAHCKARLPIDHVPSRFRFVDTLPRAHDGEVRRQALAAEARLATGPEYMPDGMAEEPS